REGDDDWSQPGALVREVMDDDQRTRFVDNVAGHLSNGVSEPILVRAFEYWRNVDKDIGDRIEKATRDLIGGKSKAPGMASAESIPGYMGPPPTADVSKKDKPPVADKTKATEPAE
ncbi:MAG: catalase-related domain-containing protein, partial [Tsuneonella sp.]